MKRFGSLLLIAALLLSLAACSGHGAGKTVYYPLAASPATLDPQFAGESGAQLIINNVFEGLTRLQPDGTAASGLAERWETSEDGLTWTFFLQPGTEWYCPVVLKNEYGEEFYKRFSEEKVTARDFVFALRRAADPATGAPCAHRLAVIENANDVLRGTMPTEQLGVSAPDDNTLVLRLSAPCPDLPLRLTESVFMPCNEDFFNATNGRYGLSNRHILCNGPFYVSAWDPESGLTIKKNRYYSGSKALPATVAFSFDGDPDSVVQKLENGSLSAAMLPPEATIPEDCTVAARRQNGVYGILFNCGDALLQNSDLRIALCSAIDRDLFLTEEAGFTPERGFVPASCIAGNVSFRAAAGTQTAGLGRNASSAVRHFSAALQTLELERVTLTLLSPDFLEGQALRQVQLWQKTLGLNLTLNLEILPAAEISAAVAKGDYQFAITGLTTDTADAGEFLARFAEGAVFRLKDDAFLQLTKQLLADVDDDAALEDCFAAESYLLQQGVCYPLYSRASSFVIGKDAADITISGGENTISFVNAKRFD
ncbi:MAG: peptide ABC transporter substrate-binding protein [Clostridia bacterium]|nr:peptide ABC transporter substrate-binding protein [Clostridia bacterium]